MNTLVQICGQMIRVEGRVIRIARLEADKYLFLSDPEEVVAALRAAGTPVDLFTFLPRLPDTSPKYSYPFEWDNLAVLPVTTFDHWWNEQIGFKARNKAKQAEKKGVVVREIPFDDCTVRGIWEVYNESPFRQGVPNHHFGESLDTVYREEATFLDHSIFIGAFLEDKMVGFIKLVADETWTQAGLMNIVSMVSHRDKAPSNALVAHAVRICAQRGIRYLVYSNFAYPKKPRSSLSDFKERNAFERVDLPRYYVPLTIKGALAWRLGFHKKFRYFLPENLLVHLRNLRRSWYARKFSNAITGASAEGV